MRVLGRVQKIPGGLMLVPMAIASVINTFIPDILQIGDPFTAAFTSNGTMCIVGLMVVFTGIQIKPIQIVYTLKRGGILVLVKLLTGIVSGAFIMKQFGLEGVWGISTLACVACITSCNPGLYIALMNNYGDELDKANYALLNLIGLPFIPVCILGYSKGYGIDYLSILATVVPLLIGMLLGCIDNEIRNFTKNGISIILPALGFCLGSGIDLKLAVQSIGKGLLLFIIFMLVNMIPLYIIDVKVLRQRGHASVAISCVAGLAMAVPKMMAEKNAAYLPYADAATAQLAFVVVLCAIITPALMERVCRIK